MNLKIKRMRELAGFFAQTVRTDGFGPTLKRSAAFLKRRFGSKKGRFLPQKETLAAQRALDYGALGWPAVSICVPLYNTPQKYLRQLLDSVLGQTCPNWQLCLADASDAAHGDVAQTVRAYQARDARIVYTKVENKGISANTNAAAALAAGGYLGLADHDDVLAPHAVYEMMKAAHETGAAFLYSDEALFTSDVRRPTAGHFKPDFAPDYLNCCNYICHFSVFRKALFDAVGGLDPACDGSQDHDLFLRLAEKTGGAVEVQLYPSGQLGGDADLINSIALDSGTVDIIITDASNFATYDAKMGISALPFQFETFDDAWAFMDSDIEAAAEEGLLSQNMRVLAHYCNGFRCVTNSKGPINSPADMNGLLIRTPENPVIMATMTALGANPQPLSFSELYQALQQKTYDAQENPIPVIYNNNLFEVQEYLSITNHIYSGMCFTIAESSWNKLSADQQQIVSDAAKASADYDRELNEQQTNDLVSALEEKGMKINSPELAPFAAATEKVLTDNADTYGDLLDQLKAWKEAR